MRAGSMDRLITIESNTPTRSASGDTVDSWSTFATVWAEKRDRKTAEPHEADRDVATIETEFGIWYLSGLTTEMRITLDGVTYDIEGVREIGRKAGMLVSCTARGGL